MAEKDLRNWKLLRDFQERLEATLGGQRLHPSWEHSPRRLEAAEHLSLFRFGLLNPVLTSMRGLCQASRLERVQAEVCRRPVSLASFSEAQHLCDPALLKTIFSSLRREVGRQPERRSQPGADPKWLRMMEVVDSNVVVCPAPDALGLVAQPRRAPERRAPAR
jgi:hypothetical protein